MVSECLLEICCMSPGEIGRKECATPKTLWFLVVNSRLAWSPEVCMENQPTCLQTLVSYSLSYSETCKRAPQTSKLKLYPTSTTNHFEWCTFTLKANSVSSLRCNSHSFTATWWVFGNCKQRTVLHYRRPQQSVNNQGNHKFLVQGHIALCSQFHLVTASSLQQPLREYNFFRSNEWFPAGRRPVSRSVALNHRPIFHVLADQCILFLLIAMYWH